MSRPPSSALCRDRRADRVAVEHVGRDHQRAATLGADQRGDRLGGRDVCAELGHADRDAAPDPGAAAGDERDVAVSRISSRARAVRVTASLIASFAEAERRQFVGDLADEARRVGPVDDAVVVAER